MTAVELEAGAAAFGLWYHIIDLGQGVCTKVRTDDHKPEQWATTREVRKDIDYKGKLVLDIGSADGMWAFEAETLGANLVVAADQGLPGYLDRFLFARNARSSKVIPMYGVFAQELFERLECIFNYRTGGELFDVAQNLGLLYHVRDVFRVLAQTRKCLKTGGDLLLETALYITEIQEPVALMNWPDGRIYNDGSTWWAPNVPCLLGMLKLSLFEPDVSSIKVFDPHIRNIGRISIRAKAVGKETVGSTVRIELGQGYLAS